MKPIYKRLKGTIANGSNFDSISTQLESGTVVAAALFISTAPTSPVEIKITDTAGSNLVNPSNYQDWQQRQGGDYITSKKPIGIEGGQKVVLEATSTINLTVAWDFEVLLIIKPNS